MIAVVNNVGTWDDLNFSVEESELKFWHPIPIFLSRISAVGPGIGIDPSLFVCVFTPTRLSRGKNTKKCSIVREGEKPLGCF